MDPRLLKYYNRELNFIREMGGEFAEEYPKIAGRLGLEGLECADPYVERLLEGFAFLAARVQLKIDSEFPRFTQHLLEMVYPQYLSPAPSATIAQFTPDLTEGSLTDGFILPRGSAMRGKMLTDELTPCDFRTAHDLTLWPLQLTEAEYFVNLGEYSTVTTPDGRKASSAIRLRLTTTAAGGMSELATDRLELFLSGPDGLPMRIYELCLAKAVGVVVQPAERPAPWFDILDHSRIERVGFEDEEGMLPYTKRSFQGYRLLQEYFMLPERFMFLAINGLNPALRRCTGNAIDIIILLSESDQSLKAAIDSSLFHLFATPAVNIFPKRTDRIHLSDKTEEYQVIPDRTRPLDFEVYRVDGVTGYGAQNERERDFKPFYAFGRDHDPAEGNAYYTIHRTPRQQSARMQGREGRSIYVGSELYVSLVDSAENVVSTNLKQLGLRTLCTNRDLSMFMQTGKGTTDFTLEMGAPVDAIRCLVGPTRPRPPYAEGETIWRLISHLSLNYLSVVDHGDERGAEALRELLTLYGDNSDSMIRKQITGVNSIKSQSVSRLLTGDGPSTFGRGIELTLTFDENAFEGSGVFLLGAVLERFFSKYSSINSFTETVVRTVDRGEIIRWPIRLGRRHVL